MKRTFLIALLSLCAFIYFAGKGVEESLPHRRLCLITGCSRSGTTYMTDVLRRNGLVARHERDASKPVSAYIKDAFRWDTPEERNKNNIIVSWLMAVDAESRPWGPPSSRLKFDHVFHQIRDPLKTINSAADEWDESWAFIRQFVPEIKEEDSDLVKSAKYWYYWNLIAEEKAEWSYRIEDLPEKLDEISSRLGLSLKKKTLKRVPRNTNTRHHQNNYTWADIKENLSPELFDNLVQLAHRYGYKTGDA